jgi:hypothetical protein
MRASNNTAGHREPNLDCFTDVRRACSEFLYRECDRYRRAVEHSKARAMRLNMKRKEQRP